MIEMNHCVRCIILFSVVSVLLILCPGRAAASEAKRFAIVIGVNDPARTNADRLYYADDDAVAIHQLLTDAGVHSVLLVTLDNDTRAIHPETQVSGPPTLQNLVDEFRSLESRIERAQAQDQRTELFIFYSGHGEVDEGEGYVVLEGGRLTRTALFEQILEKTKADRIHVIVDACKSYFLAYGKGIGGERSSYDHPFAQRHSAEALDKAGFVLSSSSDRESHEWVRFQAGVFSHEVRSALRGAADANGDGQITYAELGAFLTTANRSIPNPRFRPEFVVQAPGAPPGDLQQPILGWNKESDTLHVTRADAGHLYVEDARGVRLMDAHPASQMKLALHLPASRPLFIRRADDSEEWILTDAGSASIDGLEPQALKIKRKGALHLAFEQLFAEPFDSAQVTAFATLYREREGASLLARAELDGTGTGRLALRRTALFSAIGAASLGAAATIWAVSLRSKAEESSQVERLEINENIKRLNITAVTFYSIAGVATVTYLSLLLFSEDPAGPVSVAPAVGPSSAGLSASLYF